MVYSTAKCPKCGSVVRRKTNPVHEIGNPFKHCRFCGSIYLDSYKEEWITKSPIKRFFFFLQSGVWARAFLIPPLLLIIPTLIFKVFLLILWPILSIVWLIAGYFFHKNANKEEIDASLQRTKDVEYLNLLKQAGYKIYPIDDTKPSYGFNKSAREPATMQDLFCSQCGNKLSSDSIFCGHCGNKVEKTTQIQYMSISNNDAEKNKSQLKKVFIIAAILIVALVMLFLGIRVISSIATTTSDVQNENGMTFEEYSSAKSLAEKMVGKDKYYFNCITQAYKIARKGDKTYGYGKDAVVDYLNDLNLDYGERIIIYRLIYQTDNTYNNDIIDYLNNRVDISYDDEEFILEKLGMTVDSNGHVYWD